jgi:hypothetical protein
VSSKWSSRTINISQSIRKGSSAQTAARDGIYQNSYT